MDLQFHPSRPNRDRFILEKRNVFKPVIEQSNAVNLQETKGIH